MRRGVRYERRPVDPETVQVYRASEIYEDLVDKRPLPPELDRAEIYVTGGGHLLYVWADGENWYSPKDDGQELFILVHQDLTITVEWEPLFFKRWVSN